MRTISDLLSSKGVNRGGLYLQSWISRAAGKAAAFGPSLAEFQEPLCSDRVERDFPTPLTSCQRPGLSNGPELPVRAPRHAARRTSLLAGRAPESPSWSAKLRRADSKRAGTSS